MAQDPEEIRVNLLVSKSHAQELALWQLSVVPARLPEAAPSPNIKTNPTLLKISKILDTIEEKDVHGFFGPDSKLPVTIPVLKERIAQSEYFSDGLGEKICLGDEFSSKAEEWLDFNKLTLDVSQMCDNARNSAEFSIEPASLYRQAQRIKSLASELFAGLFQDLEQRLDWGKGASREKTMISAFKNNREPAMQGKWNVYPLPRRQYEPLTSYVPAFSLSSEEGDYVMQKLRASDESECSCTPQCFCCNLRPLPDADGHLADLCRSPSLHKHVSRFPGGSTATARCPCRLNRRECGPSCAVRNCRNQAISQGRELQLEKHLKETDTWGFDCFTRKNLQVALKGAAGLSLVQSREFMEMSLLPMINSLSSSVAFSILNSLQEMKTGVLEPRIARNLEEKVREWGQGMFRIHPKGTGVVCIAPEGLPAHQYVSKYLGEVYPSWLWWIKQEAIKAAQKKAQIVSSLPDFYNIVLEMDGTDKNCGYDVVVVDPVAKGNFASRLSHSCDPNCVTRVIRAGGQYAIAVYTLKRIESGQELTFDYSCVTESEAEYRSAVCLCGSPICRGSYMFLSGSTILQKILTRQHTPTHRAVLAFWSSCFGPSSLSGTEQEFLEGFGFKLAGLAALPNCLLRYAAAIAEFSKRELELLPQHLFQALGTSKKASIAEATGLYATRRQNLSAMLDRVRHFLSLSCEESAAAPRPVLSLTEDQTCMFLLEIGTSVLTAIDRICQEDQLDLVRKQATLTRLGPIRESIPSSAKNSAVIRDWLRRFRDELWRLDADGISYPKMWHGLAGDLLTLYLETLTFFTPHLFKKVPIAFPVRKCELGMNAVVLEEACGNVSPAPPDSATGVSVMEWESVKKWRDDVRSKIGSRMGSSLSSRSTPPPPPKRPSPEPMAKPEEPVTRKIASGNWFPGFGATEAEKTLSRLRVLTVAQIDCISTKLFGTIKDCTSKEAVVHFFSDIVRTVKTMLARPLRSQVRMYPPGKKAPGDAIMADLREKESDRGRFYARLLCRQISCELAMSCPFHLWSNLAATELARVLQVCRGYPTIIERVAFEEGYLPKRFNVMQTFKSTQVNPPLRLYPYLRIAKPTEFASSGVVVEPVPVADGSDVSWPSWTMKRRREPQDTGKSGRPEKRARVEAPVLEPDVEHGGADVVYTHSSVLGPLFVWERMLSWFEQTDVVRRKDLFGCLQLPSIAASCYKTNPDVSDPALFRQELFHHTVLQPTAPWPCASGQWGQQLVFRSSGELGVAVYGSPVAETLLNGLCGGGGTPALLTAIAELSMRPKQRDLRRR